MWRAALEEVSFRGTDIGPCPRLHVDVEGKPPLTSATSENCGTRTSLKTHSDGNALSCSCSCPSCIRPLLQSYWKTRPNDSLMLRLRRQPKGRAGGNRTIRTSNEGCLDAKHTILASMEVTLSGRPQSMIKESLSDFNATTTHIGRKRRMKEAVTRRMITGHFIKDNISK